MSEFVIKGNRYLCGEVRVSGSKNAALPLIFSTIVIRGTSVLYGLPNIGDVNIALDILRELGAEITRFEDGVSINTERLVYSVPDLRKVSRLRASSYLLGATLARFKRTHIQTFGGCKFDNRPIDMHLYAIRAVGGEIVGDMVSAPALHGADIFFDKVSVGATINALLLTSSSDGRSRIFGYAKEPHVEALIDFLVSAGADINVTDEYIEVYGRQLHSAKARIIPDMIEAGTYAALSLITGSELTVKGVDPTHLGSFFDFLASGGAVISYGEDSFSVSGKFTDEVDIVTEPYPGFPTDLQPIAAPLMALGRGGRIYEGVWQNRFGYLEELAKFGLSYERIAGVAHIKASSLRAADATAVDLRGGAALVITALGLDGQSIISSSETVKRGYENMVEKLRVLGADIWERNRE